MTILLHWCYPIQIENYSYKQDGGFLYILLNEPCMAKGCGGGGVPRPQAELGRIWHEKRVGVSPSIDVLTLHWATTTWENNIALQRNGRKYYFWVPFFIYVSVRLFIPLLKSGTRELIGIWREYFCTLTKLRIWKDFLVLFSLKTELNLKMVDFLLLINPAKGLVAWKHSMSFLLLLVHWHFYAQF